MRRRTPKPFNPGIYRSSTSKSKRRLANNSGASEPSSATTTRNPKVSRARDNTKRVLLSSSTTKAVLGPVALIEWIYNPNEASSQQRYHRQRRRKLALYRALRDRKMRLFRAAASTSSNLAESTTAVGEFRLTSLGCSANTGVQCMLPSLP